MYRETYTPSAIQTRKRVAGICKNHVSRDFPGSIIFPLCNANIDVCTLDFIKFDVPNEGALLPFLNLLSGFSVCNVSNAYLSYGNSVTAGWYYIMFQNQYRIYQLGRS